MNGYILLVTIVYLIGTGGTSSGTAANMTTMPFADFRACAEAADTTRRQIFASVPEYRTKPVVHAVCLPQSSNH